MSYIEALFSVQGRVALVAGASRGIGEAVAAALHEGGALVSGIGRSPGPEPRAWRYEQCDVTDPAAFARVCSDVVAAYERIDIYVHAAGITLPQRDQQPDVFRRTLDVNLVAAYDCTHCVLQSMGQGGSIVFVSSIGGLLGFPQNPGYAASKGGLSAMARALAQDLGFRKIRVNTIAPGYVRTSMTEQSYLDPEKHDARASRTILQRWGEPKDVVGAVLFLASRASAYVTGHELIVDGGWTAKGL